MLQQSFPDGGLRTLELQVTDAERGRDAAEGDLEKAATGKEDLEKELGRLQGEQREQERRKDFSDQVGPQVRELARQEEEVIFPNIARLERIPEERSTLQARRVRDDKAAEEARNTRVQLAIDEKEKLRLGNDLRKQLQILPAPRPTELPLEVARAAATQAEQQLRDKFPEDALLASINAAKQEAERVAESWHNFAENVRVRANELAATSAAGDRADRAEAAARAENDYSAAQRAVGEVGKALESAQSKRAAEANTFKAKALKGRREFEREDPADADDADRLAAEDDQAAADLEAKRWKLERDQKLARDDAARHKFRAQLLRDQAVRIRTDPLEMLGDIAVVIPQVDDEVRAAVTAIDSDLEVAENSFEEAAANFDAVCDQIVAWAGSDRFARVADDENGEFVRKMREMLRDKDTLHQHRVASEADTVVADLTVRSPRIVDQIAQAEATKANVAAKLSDLVADALDSLARASKLSEFPDGVGAWDGKRFIEVAPKATPTHEQISVRVGTLIDTMVHGKVEQNPVQLLWMATEASVPEGFKARILKPTPEQSSARLDVSEMQKWSGGENLTASVILYCVLARMRAEKRSGEKTAALGGVLPMDNPIGTANLRDFLLLHRKVARANGVQLAYWTALGDLGAITVFPRIVAMRKRPSQRRSGRFYVDVGEEIVDTAAASPGQELESVASVRRES